METDAIGSVTAVLFGLDGFAVLAAADAGGELELMIETTADLVGCPECGAVATSKDRRPTWVADLAIAPLQDVLDLGHEARMNLPGTASGNWGWRFTEEELTPAVLERLGDLTATYAR